MSSRPSVVFLFDLDLIHSNHVRNGEQDNRRDSNLHGSDQSLTRSLRYISSSILNHFTQKQANIQWGYRFYSSSSYQHTQRTGFQELSEQSLEEFEESLSIRYEQHTSSVLPSSNHLSKAGILGRTLQDIATDFNWKTPTDSLTPTRKGRKNGKQVADQNFQNLVFIFMDVPSDDSISAFCNINKNTTSKAMMSYILTKDLLKKFNEFQLSINFVDLSAPSTKSSISKISADLRGTVINSAALFSPFSYSQICQASRAVEQPTASIPSGLCTYCKQFQIIPKVVLQVSDHAMLANLQCWNSACAASSLTSTCGTEPPTFRCIPVNRIQVPNDSLLHYDGLYLVSTESTVMEGTISGNILWVGRWHERTFVIVALDSFTGSMIFPSSHWALQVLNEALDEATELDLQRKTDINQFVEGILSSCHESNVPDDTPQPQREWNRLVQLKGNFAEWKAGSHGETHWEMLKERFLHDDQPEEIRDINKDDFATCLSERIKSSDTLPAAPSSDAIKVKIGGSRIQNLRASQLLQKSQEVRARNDEIEREKLIKAKQVADEKREKKWKEFEANMMVLRQSVTSQHIVRLVSTDQEDQLDKDHILERLNDLKKEAYASSLLEEWHLFCLVQVIVTTILYVWRDPKVRTMELGHDTITVNFLKSPASVNRSVSKEHKIHEYRLQILLRLELCWLTPSLSSEEDVLQEITNFLQLLSIHSSPKAMSTFFQDTLVANFENMLPDLLVSLGEEMNQPIPTSLCELSSNMSARGTPSPALSSGLLSVASASSHHDVGGSQRPGVRELRSRTTLTRQPSSNLLQHMKQIAMPLKTEKAVPLSSTIAGPSQMKKEEPNQVGRVRRSLQFGMETPTKGLKAGKSSNKTPTPRRNTLGASTESYTEFTTPSKTPGLILAPETPSRLRSGSKSGRKSDGVLVVGESPEVKQEALRRSPRRMQAALALRRRASFYSTLNNSDTSTVGSSRHFARAESQVWSEKARASVALCTDDGTGLKAGHSAQFLFSKILSRNESDSNQTGPLVLSTPLKDIPELAELTSCRVPLSVEGDLDPDPHSTAVPGTPFKGDQSVQESATCASEAVPFAQTADASAFNATCDVIGQNLANEATPMKSFMKTPMKTPRHVQFDLSFKAATPSSKTCARTILKSPMVGCSSPRQNKTPLKVLDNAAASMAHVGIEKSVPEVLDERDLKGKGELDLQSPCKTGTLEEAVSLPLELPTDKGEPLCQRDDLVHKLDERTLLPEDEIQLQSPVKTAGKSTVSPLILRRSPRSCVQTNNFFNRDPNWAVVDHRRSGRRSRSQVASKALAADDQAVQQDPYEFTNEDENDYQPSALNSDTSSHKRKLFQVSAEKVPAAKRRKLPNGRISPVPEIKGDCEMTSPKTPSLKFTAPMNGSLFHLENSPLLNSLETKLNL